MNLDQALERINQLAGEIIRLNESLKSAHKRIDENDKLTEAIHDIALSVQSLANQVEHLTDKLDETVESMRGNLKAHGERIGTLELINQADDALRVTTKALETRLDKLEKEPAENYKSIIKQVIGIVIAAVIGAVIAYLTKG